MLSGEKDLLLDNHKIVRGPLNLLDDEIKQNFVGIKTNSFGFEALSNYYKKTFNLLGEEAIYEKPSLESLMLYYIN